MKELKSASLVGASPFRFRNSLFGVLVVFIVFTVFIFTISLSRVEQAPEEVLSEQKGEGEVENFNLISESRSIPTKSIQIAENNSSDNGQNEYLEKVEEEEEKEIPEPDLPFPAELDLTTALLDSIKLEFPIGRALHDNKRLLEIYYFMWNESGWESVSDNYDICLATQSSLDRMYWLPSILAHWDASISVAIHITSEEEFLILNLFVDYLDRCYPSFKDQVSLHIAVPSSVGAIFLTEDTINEWTWNTTLTFEQVKFQSPCKEVKQYMKFLQETFPVTSAEKLKLKEVYPQNHLRNIARKGCQTEWTYSVDIDIIPCLGMAENLQEFFYSLKDTPCEKCAYVIPTFELNENNPYPANKREIVSYFESGEARQFHGKIFANGHNATNYNHWATTNLDEEDVKISHPINPAQTYLYEPFYVSSDSIPLYDERFLGYGFTRNTQFQEAKYAGWNFTVLTPIYSIHWGLQTHNKLLSTKKAETGQNLRKSQTANNAKLFRRFMKELELKQKEDLF